MTQQVSPEPREAEEDDLQESTHSCQEIHSSRPIRVLHPDLLQHEKEMMQELIWDAPGISGGFNPTVTCLGAGGVCSPTTHLERLRDVAEALFQLPPGPLQLLQLQPAHGKHALPGRER